MTEYFSTDGVVTPVTIISVAPSTVTRIFSSEKDGYDSVQIGFGVQKKERVTKSRAGAMNGMFYKTLKEFRLKNGDKTELKAGDNIDASIFTAGDNVTITSVSKGKGFQGVVKRHGFAGGPRTHGQKHSEREPGSIGGGLRTHVPKGMRMAGRMGSDRITQKNLQIVFVDKENGVILLKGAVAGRRGTLVEIISK